jgi:penicillin-binding protein 1C
MSQRSAFWVTDILSDSEARSYVFGRGGSLEFPFPVAAKTGTSQAYRDNWTIGYTREITVGVWVGNFDRQPLIGSSGVTGAGPIFHAVMLAAQQHVRGREDAGTDIVDRPADLSRHTICALSGMAAGAACPLRIHEWLPGDSSPLPCSWHHDSEDGLLTLWPDRYREWAAAHGLTTASAKRDPLYAETTGTGSKLTGGLTEQHPSRVARFGLSAAAPAQARRVPRPRIEVSSPPNGATYLIDPTLRPEFQTLPLRATHFAGRVTWIVNGQAVGTSSAGQPLHWPLVRGTHRLTARDSNGSADEVAITVK